MELKLANRLESGLKAWTEVLENKSRDRHDDLDMLMDTDTPVQVVHKPGGEPKFKVRTVYLGLVVLSQKSWILITLLKFIE